MSAREQQCGAQNSNAGLEATWTDLEGEKQGDDSFVQTIPDCSCVRTHSVTCQKIRRKFGALPRLVRQVATEEDPGVSSSVRRHVCQN